MVKKFYLLILFLVFKASLAGAVVPLQEKLGDTIKDYLSNRFLNATYMFCDDSGALAGAHGIRSLNDQQLLKENEQMPIASITKSMTAASILKLQDKKLLNVQDLVSKHLTPKSGVCNKNIVPSWADKVTIHHLLTHRSGLPEYFMNMKIDIKKSHAEINKDIANFAAVNTLAFEPGLEYVYNNTNFVLLGLIVEQVSQKPLKEFYKNELFEPLGMKETRLVNLEEAIKMQIDPESSPTPIRYFVTPTGGKPKFTEAKSEFIMVPFADGRVISTNADLIKWHKALHNGLVLSQESYKLMIHKHYGIADRNGRKTYMGYGLFISELSKDCEMYYHAGNALAISGESGYIPCRKFCYSVLSNVMNYIPKDMVGKIDQTTPENQLDIHFFVESVLNAISKFKLN
ncbi:MAG: serine hydrolase domain-containing protein [Rickettsiaceae bacterium]